TGAEKQVTTDESNHFTPAISGDLVAWVDFRNGNRDIYAYDLAARREIEVVAGFGEQVAPQVAGCTVAWADDRNGSYDVYYRKLPGCTPPPAPAPVSLEPEITSTPSPVATQATPVTTPSTTLVTTPATQATPVPTTKSPGFGGIPALGAGVGAAVLVLARRIRAR
ncbi:MAG: hypothetical protein LUQ23_00675, partial [Methanomicrobiales archaeon]|nr:hypothetical protein [Methanomicrobiales archaeon]